jgi:hypothetical protein
VAADVANHGGDEMKAWAKGDRVAQPTYGSGTLVEVNEHHTVIDFDEHGRRTFATRLVVLLGDHDPARLRRARKRAVKKKTAEKASRRVSSAGSPRADPALAFALGRRALIALDSS